jgi:hypothetical protein
VFFIGGMKDDFTYTNEIIHFDVKLMTWKKVELKDSQLFAPRA